EEHPSALCDSVGDLFQCLVEQRHSLRQVDDVDVVARAIDVGRHFRIPAMRLVTEMNASFEKLAHAEFRQSHSRVLSGWPPRTLTGSTKPMKTCSSSRSAASATGGHRRMTPDEN